MARVVGEGMYATVDSGDGLIDTLVRFDLKTGETNELFRAANDIAWISLNERWLLWESEKTLYARPLSGGQPKVLARGRETYAPALEGDDAAWVEGVEGTRAQVVTQNLASGVKHKVATTRLAEFYNNFLQLRDGKLLWTDIYEDSGHYAIYDLKTAEIRDHVVSETRFRYPGYALRSGDDVYSLNFDRYDQWDWSSQQLTRYSLTDQRSEPLGRGKLVNALVVGRGALAVIDGQQQLLVGRGGDGYPSGDMSARVGGPVDTVQVSSDGRTTVAGRSLPEKGAVELFVFDLSAK